MRLLELFSGTKSWGKIAEQMGWEVISLDLQDADINTDIMEWDYKSFAESGYFDIITASPPCRTFSHLRKSWVGRKLKEHGNVIITHDILQKDIEEKGLPLLYRALDIIYYFEPKYWFIENPYTSRIKEYLSGVPFYTVDYCMYSNWGYRKRTNIFTNLTKFQPKLCNQNCGNMVTINDKTIDFNNCGNSKQIQNVRRHIRSADGGNSFIGVLGTTLKERYRIPPKLIEELFYCLLIND